MTNPTFFTVVADYKSVVVDLASDVDADPQLGPVTAKVTFTPILANGDVILATDASPRPTGYVAAPIVARIDTDGRLKLRVEPDGDRDDFANVAAFPGTGNTAKVYFAIDEQTFYRWTGSAYAETYPYAAVRLLADTALLELSSDLYYRCSFSEVVFNSGPGYLAPFTFQAPNSDVELNLIEVMRQPGQPASGITKIAPGAVRLEDGEIVFSFAGVDLPDPIPFEPSFTTAEITDASEVGVDLLTAVDASAARTAIGMSPIGKSLATASSQLAARTAAGEDRRSDLATSFVGKPDAGPPATGDEGVAVTIEDVPPIVKDGLLQAPDLIAGDPENRAMYWNQPLVGGKRVGATFKLSPGTGGLISIGLIFWEYPIPTPYKVPNSPCHFIVHKSGWEFAVFHSGVNPGTDATFTSIASGTFSSPLAEDWNPAVAGSGTLHRCELLIDGSSATIFLPDGTRQRVTDSRIASIPANVACHELFRATNAGQAAFQDIWASTSADLPIGAVDFSSTQHLSGKTLTSSTLNSPRVGTAILDSNGNESIGIDSTASAVNFLRVYNGPAGSPVVLYPDGSDTNVSMQLRPRGPSGGLMAQDYNGRNIVGFSRGSSDAVNYFNVFNSGTGSDVSIYADGTDSHIGINIVPKGALGTLKANGVAVLLNGGALGTPSSGTLTNCTFPTLNQNTTGSAASLTTPRKINGTDFNGTAAINPAPDAFLSTMGNSPAWAFVVQSTLGTNQSVLAANSGFFVPIRPRQNISVSSLAWVVATQSGNYDIGIYDSTGARLWSRGSTSLTTAGTQVAETVTGVSMVAGATYFIAWSNDNGSAGVKGLGGAGTAELSRSMDGTLAVVSVASVFPLPSTVTIGTATINRLPFIALRGSSS